MTIDPPKVVDGTTCQQVQGGMWIVGASNPQFITDLDMTKTYHFIVLGMDANEKVVRHSDDVAAKPSNPTVPKNPTAKAVLQKTVDFSWTAVDGASGYAYCYSKVSADCNTYSASWTPTGDTTVRINGLDNVIYYFRVVSFDKDKQTSPVSKEAFAIPAFTAPAVTATPGDGKVTLSWVASDDPANSYAYCYSKVHDDCKVYGAGAVWTDVDGATGTVTIPITGLDNDIPYHFNVVIKDGNGNIGMGLLNNGIITATPTAATTPATGKLNDTGITTCSDGTTNGLPCPVAGFPGQDAESGRDVTNNDDSDGHAGFSFTKISSTGAALPASAASWDCVKDNVTGLMWEVRTNDGGLHDSKWSYTWYEPDGTKNGGSAGYQRPNDFAIEQGWTYDEAYNNSCFGYVADNVGTYCNTYAYVRRVNTADLCGYKDWRMPTRLESFTIISRDRYNDHSDNPPIDTNFFPNMVDMYHTWTSSPRADGCWGNSGAWINGDNGMMENCLPKSYIAHVQLVRDAQ